MALLVRLASTDDLSEIVEALLTAADTRDTHAPDQAQRWRTLANDFGDALDALPPSRQEHDK
ncbi:hypothetical protein [Streptomyces neyagawaensis]|uniref:hypothetical protein n=1 Tax=Streptomyces neyagawaensis TaxID=42238 RepID=UPI0006E2E005|nr:hypothetical protein [Streptomyces neyagawaensis]MCL6734414.1 hypothetical protein [Streptomyces neyagawaensis]MDE1682043.1 hypothetical protein [Streptomyces neyagawaensis]